ncbi:hypothetical protein FHW19_004514 [Ochrobactrum anthropi]|nr:hypothetical protein [Brucella anthropi]
MPPIELFSAYFFLFVVGVAAMFLGCFVLWRVKQT